MKFTLDWLADYLPVSVGLEALAQRLTMAGLEVEGVEAVVPALAGVVVARIDGVRPHPAAEKLQICAVDAGPEGRFEIVCGAENAATGLFAPLALPGAELPAGVRVERSEIRGVVSAGMLCSARELGLGDDHGGLLALPPDAVPGTRFDTLHAATDHIIELSLTPNRGDCLSVLGIARELSALLREPLRPLPSAAVPAVIGEIRGVNLGSPEACPVYAGRVLEQVDAARPTPLWMRERLRRCGVRSINIVVDITNYVMLALGQPMHAFDLDRLEGEVSVRAARPGERLTLLDGTKPALQPGDTVIADARGPVALGGVMGGQESGVRTGTMRVFLESAWFEPVRISGTARRLNLHTDASHRFERGVDPTGQQRAMELATQLLCELCGARPGPLQLAQTATGLPARTAIPFRPARAAAVLGLEITALESREIFARLQMEVEPAQEGWTVHAPAYRADLGREEDLIEEIARIKGYDEIPETTPAPRLTLSAPGGTVPQASRIEQALVAAGYSEVITYSFIAPELWKPFGDGQAPIALTNPISSEMALMRPSLVPGLAGAARYNLNRQVERLRLFETGLVFRREHGGAGGLIQRKQVAGLAFGPRVPAQWGESTRAVDFFDLKRDVINLLCALGLGEPEFAPGEFPGLHPGMAAGLRVGGQAIGQIGALHPAALRALDLPDGLFAFELDLAALPQEKRPAFEPLSRFPGIRRDLALVVAEEVPAGAILTAVREVAGGLLKDLQLFDVYRGQGIDSGKKSLALGLLFQDSSSTLVDSRVDGLVAQIVNHLDRVLGASLRV